VLIRALRWHHIEPIFPVMSAACKAFDEAKLIKRNVSEFFDGQWPHITL
jgi:hypothetical protein